MAVSKAEVGVTCETISKYCHDVVRYSSISMGGPLVLSEG